MQRKHIISVGEFYHLYNRGVEKRNIFLNKSHYERFVRLLYVANGTNPYKYNEIKKLPLAKIDKGEPLVAIGAYVLMPNHFHILVKEIVDGGIAKFMEKLATGYSGYFNKLHDRVGPLFQGTYKSQYCDTDEYLKYLFAYIHLNPIKLIEAGWKEEGIRDLKKAKEFLDTYHYSSYSDYLQISREENQIISKGHFPEYFLGSNDFESYVDDFLNYQNILM